MTAPAEPEERARIVAQLIDMIYVDLATAEVRAFVPRAGYRTLLEQASAHAGAVVELIAPHAPGGFGAGGDGGESNSPSSVRAP